MSTSASSIDTGFAQEKLYAVGKKPPRISPEDNSNRPAGRVAEQMSTLGWQEVKSKDGESDFELQTADVVYLSSISPALNEERVESPDAPRPVNFRERVIAHLRDKLSKLYGDTFSHNFFVAELAKMSVGILSFQLSMLGVSPEEISSLLAEAKQQKIAAVHTGIQQLASERVLFGIVTGARV